MNDLDQRLARHLGNQAPTLSVGDTPVGTVIRRGRRRRARRRTGIGVVSVAAVASATIVTINVLSRPAEHRQITSTNGDGPGEGLPTAPVATSGVAALTTVPSNLVWNAVVPDSTKAIINTGFGLSRTPPFVAFSSAPGTSVDDVPTFQLYTSADGIEWTPMANSRPGMPLRSFDAYDGTVFTFSTAALNAAIPVGGAGDVVVESTTDGGENWETQILPIDLRALADEPGVQGATFDYRNISSGASGTIALGKVSVQLDLLALGLTDSSVQQYTADGVQVVANPCKTDVVPTTIVVTDGSNGAVPTTTPLDQCSLSTVPAATDAATDDTAVPTYDFHSWEELGISQTVVDAMLAPPHLFLRPSGAAEFTEVPFPTTPDGLSIAEATVHTMDIGYAMTVSLNSADQRTQSTQLYLSADGITWSSAEMPVTGISAFDQLADGTYAAWGYRGDGPSVAVSPDGVNWTTSDLSGLLTDADGTSATLGVYSGDIGTAGITLSGMISVDAWQEGGPTTIAKDGITVSMIDSNGAIVFTDTATGDELGRYLNDGRPSDTVVQNPQTGNIELLSPDGAVRLTLDGSDQNELYNQANSAFAPQGVLLHSDDGIHWSREDLSTIAGFPTTVANHVQSNGSTVLVTVIDPNSINADGNPTTVVLVGTPKS